MLVDIKLKPDSQHTKKSHQNARKAALHSILIFRVSDPKKIPRRGEEGIFPRVCLAVQCVSIKATCERAPPQKQREKYEKTANSVFQ